MSELTAVDLPPDRSGIHLRVHHYAHLDAKEARKPVLLLHGASANHRTFITPKADGGIATWLAMHNFDPWLLDWRGSGLVLDDTRNEGSLKKRSDDYNFNDAAEHDVGAAIKAIRVHHKTAKIAAIGFCMGGGVLAEAIALGCVTADDLDYVVLMTLGLFYEVPIDGRLKSEDRTLERLESRASKKPPFLYVDPRVASSKLDLRAPWPEDLDDLYKEWPAGLKSHDEGVGDNAAPGVGASGLAGGSKALLDPVTHMCNRVSFMYGMPYQHGNLVDEIHETSPPCLPELFGAIPLHMYIHGAKNIRAGRATFYKAGTRSDDLFVSDAARERFKRLTKVTLITGALNRLWHRDSIDRMYEWLRRGQLRDSDQILKHVIPGYGHQDLLWGKCSPKDVFPKILKALSP
jgi:pimeloyl-ACP methyl ester carboxylesterase